MDSTLCDWCDEPAIVEITIRNPATAYSETWNACSADALGITEMLRDYSPIRARAADDAREVIFPLEHPAD